MSPRHAPLWTVPVLAAACAASPAFGASPVAVVFGTSWDAPGNSLQDIVDARYGPGRINVTTDYLGAKPGEIDPWFWVGDDFSALIVREVAGNANRNRLGWYIEPETWDLPVLDGVDDGVVFDGPATDGGTVLVTFQRPARKFGFWLNPNGPLDAPNAPEPEVFFSNRFYNDKGLSGAGALHAPFDGDVQAIVFDVSRWTAPNTWLVCFEDVDSGPHPTACCAGTDNDFNDFVFEVHALGATPVVPTTFGALKLRYR